MKRLLVRLIITILSSAWIAPLTLSFWATYDFLFEILWIEKGEYQGSWHPVSNADELFYFSMVWLFIVVFAWTFHLTGKRTNAD